MAKGGKGGKQYDDTNRGVLFINDKKVAGDEKSPDFRGNINVGGVEYWLSGWKAETSAGKTIRVAVTKKDAPAAQHEPRQAPKTAPKSGEGDPW